VGTAVNRAATFDDIPVITEIYADAVATGSASFEIVPPDASEMAARMRALLDGGYPYFVSELAGTVLGYGYAGPYRSRPAYRHTVEDSIYLAASARGQGVGGALLRRLIEESTARDFRQMVAVIGDSDNQASIRLHKAAGFAMVGTLKDVGYKHGRWLDSVFMQLTLGQGATEPPTR
jgi:phosphinothricin acetyltransferase